MKTIASFSPILFVLVAFCAFSCEGPEGPQGPLGAKGDTGAQGTAGVKGDKGDTGTANVKYTEWFTPEWDEFFRSPDNLYILLNTTKTDQAILTEEAIDKSAIHIYIQYNRRLWDNANGEYKLVQHITGNSSVWGDTKIPDRTTNTINDFNQVLVVYDDLGENYFKPRFQINTNIFNYTDQKEIAVEEYKTKTSAQIRELSKGMAQFRIVVIPGAVLSAREKVVNFDKYEEVKEVFRLKD